MKKNDLTPRARRVKREKEDAMYLLENSSRQNEYTNRETAIRVAEETGGEFIDQKFHDFIIGDYWIVIWR